MTQSPVQWLVETLYNNGHLKQKPEVSSVSGQNVLRIVNTAKQIEKEQKETLYTEEQMVGFAEWIINQDRKLVLIHTKKSLLNEYIQSLKQK